jgi:hypothetical protein
MEEILMIRKKTTTESLTEMFWKFIQNNPKLATSLAFELGSLAGGAVRNSGETTKYIKKQARKFPLALANAAPRSLPAALKFFPSPKVQPRKRSHTKRATGG